MHEEIQEWIEKATSAIDENEAYRASVAPDLGRRAIDAVLADEDRFKASICSSQEDIDVVLWERRNPSAQTSPNFFV